MYNKFNYNNLNKIPKVPTQKTLITISLQGEIKKCNVDKYVITIQLWR